MFVMVVVVKVNNVPNMEVQVMVIRDGGIATIVNRLIKKYLNKIKKYYAHTRTNTNTK
jgi:hypothetical protein